LVLSYLLGSIPTGLIVARALGSPDPRSGGSGNLGTANLYRLLGLKAGGLTLLGDALKGALPTVLARLWLGESPAAAAARGAPAQAVLTQGFQEIGQFFRDKGPEWIRAYGGW